VLSSIGRVDGNLRGFCCLSKVKGEQVEHFRRLRWHRLFYYFFNRFVNR